MPEDDSMKLKDMKKVIDACEKICSKSDDIKIIVLSNGGKELTIMHAVLSTEDKTLSLYVNEVNET